MRVTEQNLEEVSKIIGYLSEFMIKIHGTTSASYINLKDRLSTAQVGLDALEGYFDDLKKICGEEDTLNEQSVIGF